MSDQVQNVTIKLVLQQAVSGPAATATASIGDLNVALKSLKLQQSVSAPGAVATGVLGKFGAALKSVNVGGGGLLSRLGAISTTLLGFGGSFALIEGIRKALQLGREAEENSARLNIALGGNLSQVAAVQRAIASLSGSSVYGRSELSGIAEQLLERGVPTDQIDKALAVVVNTASALRRPLGEVASEVAATFGGTIPRSLKRAVPALEDLTDAEKRAGGALDVLSKAFDGRAASFAATDSGKEAAALRDVAQAWEDIGKAILPLEREILPAVAKAFQTASSLADPHVRQAFVEDQSKPRSWISNLVAIGTLGTSRLVENQIDQYNAPEADKAAIDAATARQLQSDQQARHNQAIDSETRGDQAMADLENLKLKGVQEVNAKIATENVKQAKEEFDARTLSLEKYLEALQKSAAAENVQLSALNKSQISDMERLKQAIEESKASLRNLQTQRPSQEAFDADIKKRTEATTQQLHDNEITPAQYYAQLTQISADITKGPQLNAQQQEIADNLHKQIGDAQISLTNLYAESQKTAQSIKENNNQSADQQIKAVDQSITRIPQAAKQGAESVNAGDLSSDQLHDQLAAQIKDITDALPKTFNLIDKFYSPQDAEILKQRIKNSLSEVTREAQGTVDSVTPLIADLNAVGATARKSLTEGLASELTDVELRTKNVNQALKDLAKTLAKSILEAINQRLVSNVMNVVFGPEGGGKSGGSGLTGGLVGSLFGAIFSAGSQPGRGGQRSGGGGAGQPPTGSGGSQSLWSSLFSAIVGGIGGGISGIGDGGNTAGETDPSDIQGILSGVGGFTPDTDFSIKGHQAGGYTGDGPPSQPAGIVHRGEYVIPATQTAKYGGLLRAIHRGDHSNVLRAAGARIQVRIPRAPSVNVSAAGDIASIGGDISTSIDRLAEIHRRPISVAMPVSEDTAKQLINHPQTPRILAEMMQQNSSVMRPVIQSLSPRR